MGFGSSALIRAIRGELFCDQKIGCMRPSWFQRVESSTVV
jgi:hypothetical protein